MTDIFQAKEKYLKIYNDNIEILNSLDNELINNSRIKALEDFNTTGLPDKKNEDYKYTDLTYLLSNDYEFLQRNGKKILFQQLW